MPSLSFSNVWGILNEPYSENIFPTYSDVPDEGFSTRNLLDAKSSMVISTFSVPLIMKYPPGSLGSSPFSTNSSLLKPCRWHHLLFSIIGILPICVVKLSLWTLLICALTSMNVGAEYVSFLNLASTGNISLLLPSASVISGFTAHILSSLILKSSMLCGMIVGTISRFSSKILFNSFSMKLLNDSMSESTKLCSSKYFRINVLPYLYIYDHPVKDRFPCSLAFPGYFYHVSWLCT